jgi:non-ribosomal peptide synthetase component F
MALTPLEAPSGTAKFDLTLLAAESADGLGLIMEYSSDLFDAATVDRMLAHFRILLEAVVAQPDQPVGALPMLTEEERRQVLDGWSGGGSDDGWDAGGLDHLPAGFGAAYDADLDALPDQLPPGELANDE